MPEQIEAFEFESMMRELVSTEGAKLLEEEKTWNELVPDDINKKVYALLGGAAAAAAVTAAAAPAAAAAAKWTVLAGRIGRAAAGVLAAAVLVGGGTYAVSPAFREKVDDAFAGVTAGSAYTEKAETRTPGGYAIPAPGEGYEITDEASGERVAYKWFTSAENEVLVEIGYRLSGEASGGEAVVLAGGFAGTYTEDGITKTVTVTDGDVSVRVTFSNAEKEDVLSYTEQLLSQN